MKKQLSILCSLFVIALLAACGGQSAAAPAAQDKSAAEAPVAGAAESSAEEEISGAITVLTNRTDIVDTTFVEYAQKFNELYPHVTVEFEAMTDYPGEVKIRMNTQDYGDVLLIPNDIPTNQLPDFFEPLGMVDELNDKYNFVTEKAFDGQVYGIPVTGNAHGIVYNKAVFEEAGITKLPTTPDEFLEAMRQIKENTNSVPYYTNYAAGWPLVQWEDNKGAIAGDADYNNKMVHMDAPFAEGTADYTLYKLMYDLVAEGLVEQDPSTTDWELSKQLLADGDIASMVLGSWSIVQMEEKAEDPSVIGYMPFPAYGDGPVYVAAGGDYKIGINQHTENMAAAKAWVDWFLNESNFAYDQGGIPPVKGSDLPPQLATFQELNAEFIAQNPAPEGEEGLFDRIDSESEIGLLDAPNFRQRIIDAARGNSNKSFDDIMNDLNTKWAKAKAEIVTE